MNDPASLDRPARLSHFRWIRSSRCEHASCVEVARLKHFIHVRDAKDPSGAVLTFSSSSWQNFLQAVKDGDLDHST